MQVKDLKELLDKIPNESEVLIAEYMDCCGNISIRSYDEPCVDTFSMHDGKLLIKGYTDKTAYDYKRRIVNLADSETDNRNLKII